MSYRLALVVPVRGFDDAKSRLSSILNPNQRRCLARNCAAGVITRQVDCQRFVVCDDDEVEHWAHTLGAVPIRVISRGLNESLTEALPIILRQLEVEIIVIVHADLPLPANIDPLLEKIEATIETKAGSETIFVVPDRHRDGTNVLAIPRRSADEWIFSYGPDSFAAHLEMARILALTSEIILDTNLAHDLDTADDLQQPELAAVLPALIPDWSPS